MLEQGIGSKIFAGRVIYETLLKEETMHQKLQEKEDRKKNKKNKKSMQGGFRKPGADKEEDEDSVLDFKETRKSIG